MSVKSAISDAQSAWVHQTTASPVQQEDSCTTVPVGTVAPVFWPTTIASTSALQDSSDSPTNNADHAVKNAQPALTTVLA